MNKNRTDDPYDNDGEANVDEKEPQIPRFKPSYSECRSCIEVVLSGTPLVRRIYGSRIGAFIKPNQITILRRHGR
jgi:hypothetical protein